MYFYRGLSTMIGSGVSIAEAMDIFSFQSNDPQSRRICAIAKQRLDQGSSLSEAFAVFPDFFPELHINMIKYSESAGRLEYGLNSLADFMEKDHSNQQQIIIGLAYPVVLLHAAIFLLPIIDLASCGSGGYFSGVLRMLVPLYAVVLLFCLSGRMLNNRNLKTGFEAVLLAIPVIGKIARQFALTRFIRALQILISSGVAIGLSWKMAADACGNNVIGSKILSVLPDIEQGESLGRVFMKTGLFSGQMFAMINVAEKSGSLVQTLNTLATYTEKENQTAIAVVVKIIPFVFYILIAGFIGLRVISFYTSYFDKILSL